MKKEIKPIVEDKRKEKKPFKTTISAMDLGELNVRTSKVGEKEFEAAVFKTDLNNWRNKMLTRYGAEQGITYNIDFKTGNIEEDTKTPVK